MTGRDARRTNNRRYADTAASTEPVITATRRRSLRGTCSDAHIAAHAVARTDTTIKTDANENTRPIIRAGLVHRKRREERALNSSTMNSKTAIVTRRSNV
jgi:hypothetical protein